MAHLHGDLDPETRSKVFGGNVARFYGLAG